jgi:hypothetical protein
MRRGVSSDNGTLCICISSIVGLTDSEEKYQGIGKGAPDPTNQTDHKEEDEHPVDCAKRYGLGL